MRNPSARMLPNTVTLTRVTSWTQDPAKGRVPVYSAPSAPLRCSVQPQENTVDGEHGRETTVGMNNVYFATDPNLKARDLILWGAKTLMVTGGSDQAGRGRLWLVQAEERPV